MTPDAWDECGACGHDRDDHAGDNGCESAVLTPGGVERCSCYAFVEEPA